VVRSICLGSSAGRWELKHKPQGLGRYNTEKMLSCPALTWGSFLSYDEMEVVVCITAEGVRYV